LKSQNQELQAQNEKLIETIQSENLKKKEKLKKIAEREKHIIESTLMALTI
jgi:hypothetical protein